MTYRETFNYGKSMRDRAWRVTGKGYDKNVIIDKMDYDRELGLYILEYHKKDEMEAKAS